MQKSVLFSSPMDLLAAGLPLASPVAALYYQDLMHLLKAGRLDIVQRPGCSGYFLELTDDGMKWYRGVMTLKGMALQSDEVELEVVRPNRAENKSALKITRSAGPKLFRELKSGEKFQMIVGKGPHKLRYRKLNDAEEDNAETDTETPELCTFPEGQPVFPAIKGTV